MDFADWLPAEMKRQNITQADLARQSGLTTAAISNYMQGRIPDREAIRKLAKGLKLPVEIVFRVADGLSIQEPDAKTQRIINRLTNDGFTADDLDEIEAYIDMRSRIAEKRQKDAAKNASRKDRRETVES